MNGERENPLARVDVAKWIKAVDCESTFSTITQGVVVASSLNSVIDFNYHQFLIKMCSYHKLHTHPLTKYTP